MVYLLSVEVKLVFSNEESMISSLDAETRDLFVQLLEVRNKYYALMGDYNRRQIGVAKNPDPAEEKALIEYSTLVLRPVRQEIKVLSMALFHKAIDVDGLKEMLPMALMALTSSINIPLVLTVLGIDPDAVSEAVEEISSFFGEGMTS